MSGTPEFKLLPRLGLGRNVNLALAALPEPPGTARSPACPPQPSAPSTLLGAGAAYYEEIAHRDDTRPPELWMLQPLQTWFSAY